jgi:hypothetical protein
MAVIYTTLRTQPTAFRMTDKQVAFYNSLVAQCLAVDPTYTVVKPITASRQAYLTKRDGSSEIEFAKEALAYLKAGGK